MFQHVVAKLGNMRKAAEFTIYPPRDSDTVVIQSDKRIASINVANGKGMLSNGKGHPGFTSLSKFFGATEITVSADFCEELKTKVGRIKVEPGGGVIVT